MLLILPCELVELDFAALSGRALRGIGYEASIRGKLCLRLELADQVESSTDIYDGLTYCRMVSMTAGTIYDIWAEELCSLPLK